MGNTLLATPETTPSPQIDSGQIDSGQVDFGQVDPGQLKSDRLGLAGSLVAFQGLLFIITALEAALLAAISGNAAGSGPVIISAGLALFSLFARARLRKGGAIKLVRVFQWSLLAWAAIDLALALFLTGTVLPLVSIASRVGLPVAVLILTRRNRI